MSSAHNRNSVLQQFDHGNAVEMYTQWNNIPFLLGTATYVYLPKNKLHFWSSGATVKHGRAMFVTKPRYSSRNGFQGLVNFVQYLKWVLGPINNDHTHHLFHLTWWLVGCPNSWVVLGAGSQHLPLVFLEWVWEEAHHCQLGTDFQGSRSCWQ